MSESTPTTTGPGPAAESTPPYGTGAQAAPQRRVRVPHLLAMKERGERWAMLTAYDMYTAEIFDEAGIPVLLVGDSRRQQRLRLRDHGAGHRRPAACRCAGP